MKPKILVAREVFPEVIARLFQHFEVDDNQADVVLGIEGLKSRLADKHGVLTAATDPVTAEVLAAAPHLQAVCNFAVGYNNIDLAACTSAGVMATNTPGVLDDTTADLAWALLMASARRLPAAERWLRNGEWKGWQFIQWLGSDIHHATLGILGMGRIGRAIARRATGFSMPVIYHNRTRLPANLEGGARHVALPDLLRESDHLVLVVPYSPEVHHLIDAAALAQMKPTAVLVNIARGGVVDDRALVAALRNGLIAAAGLDVFENEPALHPGLLELENVVLTPHIASSTRATRTAMAHLAMSNLRAALAGQVPPSLVNPEVLQNRRR